MGNFFKTLPRGKGNDIFLDCIFLPEGKREIFPHFREGRESEIFLDRIFLPEGNEQFFSKTLPRGNGNEIFLDRIFLTCVKYHYY